MLDHAVGIEPDSGDPVGGLLKVSPDMHTGGAEPDEKRLLVGDSLVHELGSASKKLLINAGHTLTSERASIFDLLLAHLAPPRLNRSIVLVRCPTMKDATRSEIRLECRVLRIVIRLRLFLCIQVVEVAEELIEPMHGGETVVVIAQVVLAELARRVALLLEQVGNCRRPIRNSLR